MTFGNLQDRPWGKTLGTLSRRGVTGQLTVRHRSIWFQIAFDHGLVIGAESSGSAERPIALAFRQGVLAEARAAELQRRSRDRAHDWELLASELGPLQRMRLRRQAIAACVARTFVLDHGELAFDAAIAIPTIPAIAATHVGAMIFHGARSYLSEQRLADGVRALGSRFVGGRPEDLQRFGFGAVEQPLIDAVIEGTSASLLDAIEGDDVRRGARAMVYALATCGVLRCEGPAIAPIGPQAAPPRIKRSARGTPPPELG